jgi:hypothetical protein
VDETKKKRPPIALASIVTAICAVLLPFFLQNVAFYFQETRILPFAGAFGISLGIIAAISGFSALAIIIKNRLSYTGYASAIFGIILGAWSAYAWFDYLVWLVTFQSSH